MNLQKISQLSMVENFHLFIIFSIATNNKVNTFFTIITSIKIIFLATK